MKGYATTLIFLFMFSLLLVASLLLSAGVAETIEAKVKYAPERMDLAEPCGGVKKWIEAEIRFVEPNEMRVSEINFSTILLEGVLSPLNGTAEEVPPRYVARFNPCAVVDYVIWPKLMHMGIQPDPRKPTWVYLTVTGKLYDGTPWQGSGKIAVRVTANPVPPPPPPPP